MYTLETYTTEGGKQPFNEWLASLRDMKLQAKIVTRLDRAILGNFGDCKPLTNAAGLWEMREHYGSGYRIYYHIEGQKIILVLAGSSKREQDRTIKKAESYYADYKRRG